MPTKVHLTADDLEQMPDDDSVQLELDEGELITMAPASEDHGNVELELARVLANHVKANKLGRVYCGDTGFRLSDDTVRAPDVAFVRAERVPALRSKGFAKGAPDLAVEILSPANTFRQMHRKIRQYFATGCQVVWVVDRDLQEVEVFHADGSSQTLIATDTLAAPTLLPGFTVTVAELFAE
jgi:Uma2 family endonuclease